VFVPVFPCMSLMRFVEGERVSLYSGVGSTGTVASHTLLPSHLFRPNGGVCFH
jgi:hypothetical protein